MKRNGNAEQLRKAKALCDKKEKCTLKANRKMFGITECPSSPGSSMTMWIVYSCNGGVDATKQTGPKKCSGNWRPNKKTHDLAFKLIQHSLVLRYSYVAF